MNTRSNYISSYSAWTFWGFGFSVFAFSSVLFFEPLDDAHAANKESAKPPIINFFIRSFVSKLRNLKYLVYFKVYITKKNA